MKIDIRGLQNELQMIDMGLEVTLFNNELLEVHDHNRKWVVAEIFLKPMAFKEKENVREYMGDEAYEKVIELTLAYILKSKGYIIQEKTFHLKFTPPFKVETEDEYLTYRLDKHDFILGSSLQDDHYQTIFNNSDIMRFPDDIGIMIDMGVFTKEEVE